MSKYSWYGIEEVEAIKYNGNNIQEVKDFLSEYYTLIQEELSLKGKWIVKRRNGVMLVDEEKFEHAYYKIK